MAAAAILSLLQFWVGSGTQLLLLRLAIGFLLGTDYVVCKTLLTEFMPRRLRGRVLGQLSIAWAAGYACAYAAGFALSDTGPGAWRWMLLVSAVPCLLVAPLRVTIPESPLWLIARGRSHLATRIIRAQLGADIEIPAAAPRIAGHKGRLRQLCSPRWRVRTLVGCTFFTCQVIPYFAVGTFITQVMMALHLNGAYDGGLLYNLALVGGAIAGVLIVDRISRRSFLIGSFVITAVMALLLSVGHHLAAAELVIAFAVFAGVLSAASNLCYVYLPELFPTDLRGSGIGLSIAASRLGSAVGTFLLPVVVAAYGVETALGACVVVLVVGALVSYIWAPETRHLSLAALDRPAVGEGSR
jgi:putative MFS transporter